MQPASGGQSLKTDPKREKNDYSILLQNNKVCFFVVVVVVVVFFYNLNQAIFVSRSTYEFLLFEVSVN